MKGTKVMRAALILVLLLMTVPCFGAITHVQQASNSDVSGRGYTSFSATFGSATTSANAVILAVTFGDTNPAITVADTQGNTYTEAVRTYDSGHNQGSAIFYSTNITGGASHTVIVQFSDTVGYLALGIHEYSGIATVSPLDGATGSLGSGTTLSSGSITTTANGDLIFSAGVEDSAGSGDTLTAGSGFVKRVDLADAAAYADEDRIQSLAGTVTASWTLAPSGLDWIANVAAFKAATGPAGPAISSLWPDTGPAGTVVTLTGANFGETQGSSSVTFNGTPAAPTTWGATSIQVPVPSGATSGPVVVTVSGAASNAVSFTVSAIRHVQQAENGDESGATYTSFSATFGSPTTNGNAIIFGLAYGNVDSTITATDTQGNTYTEAVRRYDPGHNEGCAIFYASNITGGTSNTVTVNFGETVAYLSLAIHEYTGIATTSPVDAVTGNTGNGSDVSSGSATTTAVGDLIFSCGVEDSYSGGDTFTPGLGFKKRVDLGIDTGYADEDHIQPSAGSIAANWTLSPDFLDWIDNMAAFKTSGSSGPPTPEPPRVSAGSDQTIELPVNSTTLQGQILDPGQPTGVALNSVWTQVSGPQGVTFAAATQLSTQATFPGVGSFDLRLTVTNSSTGQSGYADVIVVVAPINQAPVVSAGAAQTITLPTTSVALNGVATDDGLPPGSTLAVSWSKVVGPGPVTFSAPSHATTQSSFVIPGTYVLRLSANDSQFISSSDVTVTVNSPAGGALAVNAGPDQVAVFPATVNLSGTVVDSLPPPGGTPTIQWSQMSGPGTATFAAPGSLVTTVTFDKEGVYTLRLTATDGSVTNSSDVKVSLGHVNCTLCSKGTDFWLMFLSQIKEPIGYPPEIDLLISSDVATSGNLSIPGTGFNQPFSVNPGQVQTITVPQNTEVDTSDTVEAKGIHITAQAPVAVQGVNIRQYTTDGFLGLPTSTLGTDYVIASYLNAAAANGFGATTGTEFGIVAVQDNTTVTVTPKMNSEPSTSGVVRAAGVSYNVTLNQGQTYQLRNNTDVTVFTSPSSFRGPNMDLTGSIVTSDKPIAVFGGHYCAFVPGEYYACNMLIEELPPTNRWGSNFLTMPLAVESVGDVFRFIASSDGTHVEVNGQPTVTLDRGDFAEQVITTPSEIAADQPILVVQYAQGGSTPGQTVPYQVDPTMIVVPPFEQFGGTTTFSTPTVGFPANNVNVIAATSSVQASSILLDGNPIPVASFVQIGHSAFSGAQISVPIGAHTVSSTLPFGATVYGFASSDAYGYPGSVCFASGVSDTTVTASPKTSTNPVTSQVSVQATVNDSSGNPIGGAGVTFKVAGVNSQTHFATTNSAGVAVFTYTSLITGSDLITITAGTATDTSSITWASGGPNQPPVVSAGPNLTLVQPNTTAQLNGSVVDDGLPIGGTLTSAWIELSGPATVSFSNPAQPITNATFPQPGTYVLQLTGNDSQLSTSSTVTVTVFPPNQPPVVNAGANQTYVLLPTSYPVGWLTGTATDDGLPVGSTLTHVWRQVSGPDMANIYGSNQLSVQFRMTVPGPYVFALSASDGQYTSTAYTIVTAVGPPVVNAGQDQSALVNTQVALNGSITLNGQPAGSSVSATWTVISGPGPNFASNVTFSNAHSPVTQATFSQPGTYVLQLGVDNTAIASTATIYVTSTPPTAPTVALLTPSDGSEITKPTFVTGSISDGNWTLEYALQDEYQPMTFTTLASGTGPVTAATLGTLDPTLLLNGTYVLRLRAINSGGLSAATSVNVRVTRNMKIGIFTISFNDLTVPVAGIPIQVVRTYDSRDKGVGDFGIGWRLSLANLRLQKSRNLGLSWNETVTVAGLLPEYCLQPNNPAVVTVRFPDGRVYSFQETTSQPCQAGGPVTAPTVTFSQLSGPANTAGAMLVPADGGSVVIDGNVPGPVNVIGFDGNVYNPTSFVLTTADGTSYTIDQQLGLTSVRDTNGNSLTVNVNGIVHSSGKSISILRDAQGRVARIVDPDGAAMLYSYDDSGNLVGYSDRQHNLTAYTYVGNHNLMAINGPDGNQALYNSYDSSKRLTTTYDPILATVQFNHDLANRKETITDRRGNATEYVYDDDGNVIQTTDALGNSTSAAYDAGDNKLSDTNALGKTTTYTYDGFGNRLTETDPLNHVTTYTYNGFGKPLTVTDPNGHVTTNTYDGSGNLLTTRDPLGNTTTNTYSLRGLLVTTQDALGHTTSFGYDPYGNMTSQTDANGTVTSYAYDANGNRTSQSVTRTLTGGGTQTLTTTYQYDGNNRLVQTNYPDGSATQTVYDNLGHQTATFDAFNHQTTYQYDADGRLTKTTYPDGSTETSSYDINGNRIQFTDRAGTVIFYSYDVLNRQTVSHNYQTGALAWTDYDAAGQVISTWGRSQNTIHYGYDDAGRRTSITDPLNHTTTFAYDAAGNQTSVLDANNHTTQYAYDANNRRTRVTYPDNNFETTTYDALGRVTSRTDPNGKVTQFVYDNLGRLTSVTQDAGSGGLNLVTSYSYDEVGNRLTQTDAKQHTTSYQYDQRGRRTHRTLPLGQSESYTYDVAGNLLSRTDFNGKITTYAYDNMNRLSSKTPAASFNTVPVTFTYAASGKRATMVDASGTTTYTYDGGDRLLQKVTPQGTISYTYDDAGYGLGQVQTVTAGGGTTWYNYDVLSRLLNASTPGYMYATYGYDNVGNLQNVAYLNSSTGSNAVVHNYAYDQRNRLTNLGVNGTVNGVQQPIASYAYTLDAAGHRTSVTELSGRTVNYSYDNLYRLTNETIAADPNGVNGAVNYTYDNVGNRTHLTSTLAPVPAGLWNYDANDRFTAGDTYDANGNTVSSGGIGYTYDFENRLVQKGGMTIVYDGDGNRVSKTVGGVSTTYLVDDVNPTGYAQVVLETTGSETRQYGYGLELISQLRTYTVNGAQQTQKSYYVHDGHGSVRALTDTTGVVTDTYDYDAFGNLLHSIGSTPNNYLFAGEQYDPDLGLYYNRARYLNVSTGRFWTMDDDEGDDDDPSSIHKYLYAEGDPVDNADPGGNQIDAIAALGISETLAGMAVPNLNTMLKFVNDSVNKVPLSDGAYESYLKWKAEGMLDILNNCDCFNFLAANGISSFDLASMLAVQVPYDGTKSKITEFNAGIYPNGIPAERAENYPELKRTVQEHFRADPGVRAEAQTHGAFRTDVYLRPGAFNKITIEHEGLHNLTGLDDDDLADQLGGHGLSGDAASMYISKALHDNRCDKLTPGKKKKNK